MNESDRLVVAVAIVRSGRVLAARRTGPGAAAGRWELPGGKAEPGESLESAAVREIAEELGCVLEVTQRLAGEARLDQGLVLRSVVGCARGEPVLRAHDAYRWLGPEELDAVDWLEADRPFLEEIRPILLQGERFGAGNVGGAVRIGPTVRRPSGPWTPLVHDLMRYVDDVGAVPRVLGYDEVDREVLAYVPGRVVDPDRETVSDALLRDGVAWLRRYHDRVRSFRPSPERPWRDGPRPLDDGQIVCHNDFACYNWVVQDDRVVGVLDWDMAAPGEPLSDLAFLAWNTLPLYREIPTADVVRRLVLLAETYGRVEPSGILKAVDARMTAACDRIEAGQRRGDEGFLNLANVGEPGRTRERLAAMRVRVPAIAKALHQI